MGGSFFILLSPVSAVEFDELRVETDDSEILFDDFSLEMDLFGFEVNPTNENAIIDVEKSSIFLSQSKDFLVDISVEVDGDKFTFGLIEPKLEIIEDANKNTILRYTLNNPRIGFFSMLEIQENKIWVNIAFTDNERQLNLDGICELEIKKGTLNVKEDDLVKNWIDRNHGSNYLSIEEMKKLCFDYKSNIIINNKDYLERIEENGKSINEESLYALTHKNINDQTIYTDALDNIVDDLEDESGIDIGVHREFGTKAQVLSDISFYCVDIYEYSTFSWVNHDLRAYSIYAHGGPSWNIMYNPHEVLILFPWPPHYVTVWDSAWVYVDDIEDLWGIESQGNLRYDTFPTDCIIQAGVCDGLWPQENGPMADNWLDFGADAFVGSRESFWISREDLIANMFWGILIDGGTVSQATAGVDALQEFYTHIGDWNYCGTGSAVLP